MLDANAVLRPGEQLVTYASVGDRPHVPGVQVGVITRVQASAASLTKSAYVCPFANDDTLGVVGVVIAPRARTQATRCCQPRRPAPPPPPGQAPPGSIGYANRRRPANAGLSGRRVLSPIAASAFLPQLTVLDNPPIPGRSPLDAVLVAAATSPSGQDERYGCPPVAAHLSTALTGHRP